MNGTTMRRPVAVLLGVVAAAALAVVTLLVPGIAPWSPAPPAAAEPVPCQVQYLALDPNNPLAINPAKETIGAFGPGVTARDETGIKAELAERRLCGADNKFDPALTAAHYALWSSYSLTSQKVGFDGIDAFAASIAADPILYGQVVAELERLEGESVFTLEPVSAGTWSLFMVPNGSGGVTTKVGTVLNDGTNAVFTHGDIVVRYRLECGFQPNRPDNSFPGAPVCNGEECGPPYVPPPTEPTQPTCPTGQVVNDNGVCVTPKSDDPADYRQPGDGGEGADVGTGTRPPSTVDGPAQPPAEVETSVTNPNTGVTDSSTSAPGSETGGQAAGTETGAGAGTGNGTGAGGAETYPTETPSNEGGNNDGRVSDDG